MLSFLFGGVVQAKDDLPFQNPTVVQEVVRNDKILVASATVEVFNGKKYETEIWTMIVFFGKESKQLAEAHGTLMLYSLERKVIIYFYPGENI